MEKKETKKRYKSIIIDGASYKTHLPPKYEQKKKFEPVNLKHIKAFIPGTILEVFVEEGDEVKKNDPLLTLDAMKMNNVLRTPMDGKIKKIYIKVNSHVIKNELLLELE
jgi:biotin carboxyl carrier protein